MIKNVIFDFDGIIANSNQIKINILCNILAKSFDCRKKIILEMIKKHPGKNRLFYINKLEIFFCKKVDKQNLLKLINIKIKSILPKAKTNLHLHKMRSYNRSLKWFILTSGNVEEVKEYLKKKKILFYFNDVFGENDNKFLSYKKMVKKYNLKNLFLVIGDGSKDYNLIKKIGARGLLVIEWSQEKSFLKSLKCSNITIIDKMDALYECYKKIINYSNEIRKTKQK